MIGSKLICSRSLIQGWSIDGFVTFAKIRGSLPTSCALSRPRHGSWRGSEEGPQNPFLVVLVLFLVRQESIVLAVVSVWLAWMGWGCRG